MGNQVGGARSSVEIMSELAKVSGTGTATAAGDAAGTEALRPEPLMFAKVLGGGRFLKSLQCWHHGNMMTVKAYAKTQGPGANEISAKVREQAERLDALRQRLNPNKHPNLLPYSWLTETRGAAFLVRPFVQMSLRERLAARPFLSTLEKNWITFQLLEALRQCESVGFVHGDVKANNILVTSWNWVVLTDLTGMKPPILLEDNPADLSYFFDDDYHKRCYVAPERFYHSSTPELQRPSVSVAMTSAIDLFSAGCVIAELYLDGASLFTLSELLAYRKGEHSPQAKLSRLHDPTVREMSERMMSLVPYERKTAGFYLDEYRGKTFPAYFSTFLHKFAWASFSKLSPDECIATIGANKDRILKELGGTVSKESKDISSTEPRCMDLVNVLVMVTASMRSVVSPEAKVEALRLLSWGAPMVDDHLRLQRLLPYMAALVSDEHEASVVRATSIEVLADLLARVSHFPLSEQQLFQQYVLPILSTATSEEDEVVALAYARNLGSFAQTARRFLDTAHAIKVEEIQGKDGQGDTPDAEGARGEGVTSKPPDSAYQLGYDAELATLQEAFVGVASEMLSSSSTAVKRMILSDILRLCVLLGRERTNNALLPLIITVLNDRSDWELRAAFFDNLVGVASFVGRESLQHFILPCIVQALTDMHELVVEGALKALASLVQLSLLTRQAALAVVQASLPLLLHPAGFLRMGVVGFLSALAEHLGPSDAYCFLVPMLRPYLKHEVWCITTESLLEALKQPVSRYSFLNAIDEARKIYDGASTTKQEGGTRDNRRETEGGELLQEEDAAKLQLLRPYIETVAQARLTQQKADEQQVMERRQEQEALASEEWLQEEWDSFFGAPLAPPAPMPTMVLPAGNASDPSGRRARSEAAQAVMLTPLDQSAAVLNIPSPRSRKKPWDPANAQPGEGEVPLGDADPAALNWLASVSMDTRTGQSWRPKGVLVANLDEHKKPVTSLCICDDHSFFATGAEDGTVKVWESFGYTSINSHARESSAAARLTYSSMAGKITALSPCEGTMSLAAASSTGAIHVVRVDAPTLPSNSPEGSAQPTWPQRNFSGMTTVRTLDYSEEQSVMAMGHCSKGNSSMLLATTQHGYIHAHDLRQKNKAWTVEAPPQRGVPMCLAVGNDRNWLVVGTSRGYLMTYDIRFQIDVQWWRHPCKGQIFSVSQCAGERLGCLQAYSKAHSGPYIVSATDRNQISIWDVSSATCLLHFSATSRGYVSDMSDIPHRMGAEDQEHDRIDLGLRELDSLSLSEEGVHSVWMAPDCSCMLSGGFDRRIRLWDVMTPDRSSILGDSNTDSETCVYGNERIRGPMGEVLHIFERKVPSTSLGSGGAYKVPSVLSGNDSREAVGARGSLPSPSDEHQDGVTQLGVLRSPWGPRLISTGRDGFVKVWC